MGLRTQSLYIRVVTAERLMRCLVMTTMKWRVALTTADSSEVRNGEGEMKDSFMIMEVRNFDPHVFREREAMVMRTSPSLARSSVSVREMDLTGKPVFPGGRRLESLVPGLAVNMRELLPKGDRAALSSLSKIST